MTEDDCSRGALTRAGQAWLNHLRNDRLLAPGTVRTYQSVIRYLVASVPDDCTADDIMAAVRARIGPQVTSANMRRASYVTLNGFFHWWERNGGPPNPLEEVKSPPPSQARRRPLTAAEDAELREVIGSSPRALRLQLHLMRGLGLRLGDVVSLQVQDMDFAGNRLRCRQGKGGTDVWLPLGGLIAAAAQDYLDGREADGEAPRAQRWLFPSPISGHVTTRAVDKAFRKAAGWRLRAVSLHCLRHSFCTDLVTNGAPINTVQRLMRHTNLATTAVYMGSDPGAQARAVEDLQDRLAADGDPPAARPVLRVLGDIPFAVEQPLNRYDYVEFWHAWEELLQALGPPKLDESEEELEDRLSLSLDFHEKWNVWPAIQRVIPREYSP